MKKRFTEAPIAFALRQADAGGMVFGRDAIRAPRPHTVQVALRDVVWEGAEVNDVSDKCDPK